MPEIHFRAQALIETNVEGSRAELKFENENGERATISLPLRVAVAIGPVCSNLAAEVRQNPGGPQHVENLVHWSMGQNDERDHVILLLNDRIPLALPLRHAKEFVDGIQKIAADLKATPPSVRQ